MVISLFIVSFIVQNEAQSESYEQPQPWVAYPMYISPFAGTPYPTGYSPIQIKTAYNLPSSGGAGTTIAIIDAYDTPNILDYYNTFSSQYNLPDNSTGNFIVHPMAQNIQPDSSWTTETCLDVEWAHAIAPNAKILLVEATGADNNALFSAIDYATSQPGVVAVSMSWGGDEFPQETTSYFESHFNKPGITFFASSGDDGTSPKWPAVSAKVVSVGGTSLNLNPDGTIISETAWRNSSGGLSIYVPKPSYQTNYGLSYTKRAVPDVSYNGNPLTGVSVYNGAWIKVGGTSAGAPQWAAIHAIGLSATNNNLYARAKTAYSSYFRDITFGSNYVNQTETNYDLVTGLGSPLTTNFGTQVSVSPTSGPPNSAITLNGNAFTMGSSVNISYRNPTNGKWIPIIDNWPMNSENFSYHLNAPDTLQVNSAGDNQPQFDNIIFRVIDNYNGRAYNTAVPYMEWRRGLSQVGNITSLGLFGNNTNLAADVFLKNGDLVPILGQWFNPGSLSLIWDNKTILGTISIDINGSFNGTFQVPTTTAGQHVLTINDGLISFFVCITRLPTIANNYVDQWHNTDFAINLLPDYSVNETFYRINEGEIFNIATDGQPTITNDGYNNTLEYWSTWNVYGSSVNELPHTTLSGIKLDKTPPTGTIISVFTTLTSSITLTLSATDEISGVAQMRFSNDNSTWSNWEPYQTTKTWTFREGDSLKTVSVQFSNNAGLISTYSYTLTPENLQPPVSTPTQIPTATIEPTSTETPYPTPTSIPILTSPTTNPIPELTLSPTTSAPSSPKPTSDSTNIISPNNSQTPLPTLPEIPLLTFTILVLASLLFTLLLRKKQK